MPVRHYTNAAEDIAVRFLRACDVNVLSRNDRRFGAEMDIVGRAKAGADLLIFEVKQWQSRDAFPAVSLAQRRRLTAAVTALEGEAGNLLPVQLHALLVNPARRSVCLVPLAAYGEH
jgi:Holliday junction resolvase-like predicted endonuclease